MEVSASKNDCVQNVERVYIAVFFYILCRAQHFVLSIFCSIFIKIKRKYHLASHSDNVVFQICVISVLTKYNQTMYVSMTCRNIVRARLGIRIHEIFFLIIGHRVNTGIYCIDESNMC